MGQINTDHRQHEGWCAIRANRSHAGLRWRSTHTKSLRLGLVQRMKVWVGANLDDIVFRVDAHHLPLLLVHLAKQPNRTGYLRWSKAPSSSVVCAIDPRSGSPAAGAHHDQRVLLHHHFLRGRRLGLGHCLHKGQRHRPPACAAWPA